MADLLELAARCEAAEGADRELADEILYALGFTKDTKRRARGGTRQTWRLPFGRHVSISFDPTSSLDAAITLVPEGWNRAYRWSKTNEAHAAIYDPEDMGTLSEALGKTEALALCAAALRAHAVN